MKINIVITSRLSLRPLEAEGVFGQPEAPVFGNKLWFPPNCRYGDKVYKGDYKGKLNTAQSLKEGNAFSGQSIEGFKKAQLSAVKTCKN